MTNETTAAFLNVWSATQQLWLASRQGAMPHQIAGQLAAAPDVIKLGQERRRQDEINRGQLRIGTPGDWYATIRWSDQAWNVLWPITFWR